jgi:hypothetical protein
VATIRCVVAGLRSVAAACPALPHATASCDSGAPRIVSCSHGFADADGAAATGCEADLGRDPRNCGAVGASVPAAAHASVACVDGRPSLTCDAGRLDADGAVTNGCETDLSSSREHCGAVGRTVPAPGKLWHVVSIACVGGEPTVLGCETGWDDADGDHRTGCEAPVPGATPTTTRPGGPVIVLTVAEPDTAPDQD